MAKKKKRRLKKSVFIIMLLIAGSLISYSAYTLGSFYYNANKAKESAVAVVNETWEKQKEEDKDPEVQEEFPNRNTYSYMHGQNQDYQGWMKFNSGIIDLPVMYSDKYMYTDWQGNWVLGGTPLMDSNVSGDNTNSVIYGHSVFQTYAQTQDIVFSCLHYMKDPDYYNANSTFKIYWNDHVSTYKIFSISEQDSSKMEENWMFLQPNFTSESEQQKWIDKAKQANTVPNDVPVRAGDKTVTLQTCQFNGSPMRIVICAVETERVAY
jgi:SrtB family sortase